MNTQKILRLLPCALLAAFATQGIAAEWQPNKPIRMLVGFAPGGGTDATARAVGPRLGERLGQQIIIDNRPGAAGNIATDITAKATPDGHTILMGTIAALGVASLGTAPLGTAALGTGAPLIFSSVVLRAADSVAARFTSAGWFAAVMLSWE